MRVPAIAALVLAAAAGAGAAGAAPRGPRDAEPPAASGVDAVHYTVQVDGLSGAPRGAGAGVEWRRAWGGGRSLGFGAYGFGLGDLSWGFVRLGASFPAGGRLVLGLGGDVGRGRGPVDGFAYLRGQAVVSVALLRGRLYGEIEEQYLDIAHRRGHLLRLGTSYHPHPALGLRLDGYRSFGGDLGSRYVSARVDATIRGRRAFLGASLGRIDVVTEQAAAPARTSHGVFAGADLPFFRAPVLLSVEAYRVQQQTRVRAALSWRHSLRVSR